MTLALEVEICFGVTSCWSAVAADLPGESLRPASKDCVTNAFSALLAFSFALLVLYEYAHKIGHRNAIKLICNRNAINMVYINLPQAFPYSLYQHQCHFFCPNMNITCIVIIIKNNSFLTYSMFCFLWYWPFVTIVIITTITSRTLTTFSPPLRRLSYFLFWLVTFFVF